MAQGETERSVELEVTFIAQMSMSWPDLIALAQWEAERHGAPAGTEPRIVRVATPGRPGLWVFHWCERTEE